ncbi:MAG: 2-succinyl-5-enolpyruvyl-6-hydroxy-3-cyclohexene-1-carboxylic-acid synthase [Actinomycetes bacterium]
MTDEARPTPPAPPNPATALARVLVDELARGGVTDAVVCPGSRSTALAVALHEDPRVRCHVHLDERSAAFVALGLGRATGRPAAVVTTSGSAVANLHPAVVEADTGAVPLLLLTADRPPELRQTGANQTIEQVGIFDRAVRFAVDLGVPDDRPGAVAHWRSTVARAVAEAQGLAGPPGPVHVDLPFREPTVPVTDDGRSRAEPFAGRTVGRPDRRPWVTVVREPRQPDPAGVRAFAGRVAGTERGLVVVGGGADVDPGAVVAFGRAAGWPVVAEPHSGCRVDDDVVVAHAHHLLSHGPFARAHRPEVVVRFGRTGLSRALASALGPEVPQVQVDPTGAWHDPERAVAELVLAEPTAFCRAVAAELPAGVSSDWWTRWRQADDVAEAALRDVLDADDTPTEPRVARDLAASLPGGAVLVVGSSMPIRDLDLVLKPRTGLRVLANRGASGIDGVVSTALGVALAAGAGGEADPAPAATAAGGVVTGPVTALVGDLTLLHDTNAWLLSPAAERCDLVVVVVDNDGGGIFHLLPQATHVPAFERLFGTPHGRDLADLARLHGLVHHPVTSASALPGVVADAHAAGGRHLVHVRTDREENRRLHGRMAAAVEGALDALA